MDHSWYCSSVVPSKSRHSSSKTLSFRVFEFPKCQVIKVHPLIITMPIRCSGDDERIDIYVAIDLQELKYFTETSLPLHPFSFFQSSPVQSSPFKTKGPLAYTSYSSSPHSSMIKVPSTESRVLNNDHQPKPGTKTRKNQKETKNAKLSSSNFFPKKKQNRQD